MPAVRLHPKARLTIVLQGLYHAAEALCLIFVSVFFFVVSLDFKIVAYHYIAVFAVTPIVFQLAGWYSQTRDRLHVYRLGLVLHAAYYALLLVMRDSAPDYAVLLGVLLGITWGIYWPGVNIFTFDVTYQGQREYYFGLMQVTIGVARLVTPLLGGVIITLAPNELQGYYWVFGIVVAIYLLAFALSFGMTSDADPRPFRLRRALFPGPEQRDWRLIMWAAATLAGAFQIFNFLLGLLMYIETDSAFIVGAYASLQGLVGIGTSFVLGKQVVPQNRKQFLFLGMVALVLAGFIVLIRFDVATLFVFGVLRAFAGSAFSIAHFSLRLDIISESAEEPAQRIEYICAWEVPLGIGRVLMMLMLLAMFANYEESSLGIRMALFCLCCLRILTYLILVRTSMIGRYARVA